MAWFLSLSLMFCWVPSALAATASPANLVAHPGTVLVDVPVRRAELKHAPQLCKGAPFRTTIPQPIADVSAPKGYGTDNRFASIGETVMAWAAGCLGGDSAQCKRIVELETEWASADAPQIHSKMGNGREPQPAVFFNDSLSVNLHFMKPAIVAYAIARETTPVDRSVDASINEWIKKVLARSEHMMRDGSRQTSGNERGILNAAGNHAIASASALMAYGGLAGASDYFRLGLDQWTITLGSMRSDGSLPIETRRGARAIFYTGRAIEGLISIAEMARLQGIDLYSKAAGNKKDIHAAVAYMLDALENTDKITLYAKENFAPGPSDDWKSQDLSYLGNDLGWIVVYMKRFPDHQNTIRIRSLKLDRRIVGQQIARIGDTTVQLADARILNADELIADWFGSDIACFYGAP